MTFQPKHHCCKKVAAKNLNKGHAEKDVKLKWAAKAFGSAVDGIKIFDNDDQVTKHYCCLPTAKFYIVAGNSNVFQPDHHYQIFNPINSRRPGCPF